MGMAHKKLKTFLFLLGLGLIIFGLSSTGCSIRKIGLVRSTFYPKSVAATATPLGEDTAGARFDHAPLDRLFKQFVEQGVVDYAGLATEQDKLDAYIKRLSSTKIDTLGRHAQLAFWINAYNACTLKLMLEHPGVESIKDIPEAERWKAVRWIVAGEQRSLDEIEHDIIRPKYLDARIHFALVCAAHSCPWLRSEAFTGDKLMAQLDDQARDFFARPDNLQWDAEKQRLDISELMDWFRDDFAAKESDLIDALKEWFPAEVQQDIAKASKVRLGYLPYDWGLNGSW